MFSISRKFPVSLYRVLLEFGIEIMGVVYSIVTIGNEEAM
jgi:hypothetical protein